MGEQGPGGLLGRGRDRRDQPLRRAGRDRGADNTTVYAEMMGFSEADIEAFKRDGVM